MNKLLIALGIALVALLLASQHEVSATPAPTYGYGHKQYKHKSYGYHKKPQKKFYPSKKQTKSYPSKKASKLEKLKGLKKLVG